MVRTAPVENRDRSGRWRPVIHVVENEGCRGLCMPEFVRSGRQLHRFNEVGDRGRLPLSGRKEVFSRAGRVQIARSFALSSFLSRRTSEDHEAPRSIAMLRHREPTKRISAPSPREARIGLTIEVHRHTGAGLLESFHAAALDRARERVFSTGGVRGSGLGRYRRRRRVVFPSCRGTLRMANARRSRDQQVVKSRRNLRLEAVIPTCVSDT
jgi:hypothetical protein